MKRLYLRQALQFYQALRRRDQTWPRSMKSIKRWAKAFEAMSDEHPPQRIQRVLDWWCRHGCGALFVPWVGTPESFADKFIAIRRAKMRLQGQPLTYFDDVLAYEITADNQRDRIFEKLEQQKQFIQDLSSGRVKLPKAKRATIKPNVQLTPAEELELSRWHQGMKAKITPPVRNPNKNRAEYKAGKRAYWAGKQQSDNPYPNGHASRDIWKQGWNAAEFCEVTNPKVAAVAKARYRHNK